MAYSFWQRFGSFLLLGLFLTPLVTTEWHDLAYAKNSLKPWTEKECSGQPFMVDQHHHALHHCAVCDFHFSQTLLPELSFEVSFPKFSKPDLVSKTSFSLPSIVCNSLASRGPPRG